MIHVGLLKSCAKLPNHYTKMLTTLFKCQVRSNKYPEHVPEVRMTADGYPEYVPEVTITLLDGYPEYVPEVRMALSDGYLEYVPDVRMTSDR